VEGENSLMDIVVKRLLILIIAWFFELVCPKGEVQNNVLEVT
jgi:hypothetical protein